MYRKDRQAEELSFKAFLKSFFNTDYSEQERETFFAALVPIGIFLIAFIVGAKYMSLFEFIFSVSSIFFYAFSILFFAIVYTSVKHKSLTQNRALYILLVISLILAIPYTPKAFGYKTTDIGDFYEADTYTEKYYVIMSRDSEDVENRKEYTLPAKIERRYNVYNELRYYINRLYFPNGGYLVFDYDEALEDSERTDIELNKETEVIDYHDDCYYITLTDKKVTK